MKITVKAYFPPIWQLGKEVRGRWLVRSGYVGDTDLTTRGKNSPFKP
jgi:hypothetical protein